MHFPRQVVQQISYHLTTKMKRLCCIIIFFSVVAYFISVCLLQAIHENSQPVATNSPKHIPLHAVKVTDHLYFKVKLGNKYLGRMVFGLFGETVPKTVANVKALCLQGDAQGRNYNGSTIHRVIKGFVVQGGDVVNGDGTGVTSIYGPKFDDENFITKHTQAGLVNMANSGPNTNGCQWAILTIHTPHLDGKHVVFAKVVEGYESVVKTVENTRTGRGDKPLKPVVLTECGIDPLPNGPYYLNLK